VVDLVLDPTGALFSSAHSSAPPPRERRPGAGSPRAQPHPLVFLQSITGYLDDGEEATAT
jgi:hypothetical protein